MSRMSLFDTKSEISTKVKKSAAYKNSDYDDDDDDVEQQKNIHRQIDKIVPVTDYILNVYT